MTDQEVSLVEILREIREVGADTATIKAHLSEIDSQLALLPKRKEIDDMREAIQTLQENMTDLEANFDKFKKSTALSEKEIADDAGTANDADHKEMAKGQADKAVSESEIRTGVQLDEIKVRLNIISQELSNLSGITLIIIGISALVLAVLVNIGWQAFV